MAKSKKKTVKKRKIKYRNIFKLILFLAFLTIIIYSIITLNLKNIYIKGNTFLSDQYIIDLADIRDYPNVLTINSKKIKENLESDIYIDKVEIKRHNFLQGITINITENNPVLYYEYESSYLLEDGTSVDSKHDVPTLINQTPEDILKKLLISLGKLDQDVLNRISEIRYYPSEVDEELFYLTMIDDNYIYINFNSFAKLNDYIEIKKSLNNKTGIIHLDSGDYLEVVEKT